MLSRSEILERLADSSNDSASKVISEENLNRFADFYADKWDENTSCEVIAESCVDFLWNTDAQVELNEDYEFERLCDLYPSI